MRAVMSVLLAGLVLGSCDDGTTAPEAAAVVPDFVSEVVAPRAVRISWEASPVAGLGYAVERRVGFSGAFTEVGRTRPQVEGVVAFIDTTVASSTLYGYRVRGVTLAGGVTAPSLARGVETPPAPGLFIATTAAGPTGSAPAALRVVVERGDTVLRSLITPATSAQVINPLAAGPYRVRLRNVPATCAVQGDSVRTVQVRDDRGARTLDSLEYKLDCRDPRTAELVVRARVTGVGVDTLVRLQINGSATQASLPDSLRVVNVTQPLRTGGTTVEFRRTLYPGTYSVQLDQLAPNCTLNGTAGRAYVATAGAIDTVNFEAACVRTRPEPPPLEVKPVRMLMAFTPLSAVRADTVTLTVQYDQTALGTERGFSAIEFTLGFDDAALAFVDFEPADLAIAAAAEVTPGTVLAALGNTQGQRRGNVVQLGRFRFRVLTATETSVATETRINFIERDIVAGTRVDTARVWVEEAELGVRAAGGTPTNPPGPTPGPSPGPTPSVVAEAGGPYSGTAGTPIQFSSAGSTVGTGVAYRWFFPGGLESSQQSPQFTFSTAGSYVVRLEVAQGTVVARDSAFVTVTAAPTPSPGPSPNPTPNPNPTPTPSPGGTALYYTFSAPAALGTERIVTMTVYLDLSQDNPQTNGPEVLGSWSLAQLRFDPAVLAFRAGTVRVGQWHNITSSSDQPLATQGILSIAATTTPGQPNRTGLVQLARIDFALRGAAGARTTTQTALGAIIGSGEVSGFNYTPFVSVQEATFVIP
jgi:hypothetical protein